MTVAGRTLSRVTEEEDARVEAWELERMLELGLPETLAAELAARGVSWHDVDDLLKQGCDVRAAFRIAS